MILIDAKKILKVAPKMKKKFQSYKSNFKTIILILAKFFERLG